MIVVKDLKLNKFRNVSIPSNKDLYERIGPRSIKVEDGQVANFNLSGLSTEDQLEDFLAPGKMPIDEEI